MPLKNIAATIAVLTTASAPLVAYLPDNVYPEEIFDGTQRHIGAKSLEGPAWVPAPDEPGGGYLIFSIQDGPFALWKWQDGTATEYAEYSMKVNGNAVDSEGRLVTCESGNQRVVRRGDLSQPDDVEVLVDSYDGHALNQPNDVVVKSDGTIWFTTPTWSGGAAVDRQYVLVHDPATNETKAVVDNVDKPNGLGFSPDEKTFYLNDNGGNRIIAYDIEEDNTLSSPRILVRNIDKWPDGMAVDRNGKIFAAYWGGSGAGIHVLDTDGTELDFISMAQGTTNCTFGGPHGTQLFITSGPKVYRMDLSSLYPPTLGDVQMHSEADTGNCVIEWPNDPAAEYQLQQSSDLINWQDVGTPIREDSADTARGEVSAGAEAFYRVLPAWR